MPNSKSGTLVKNEGLSEAIKLSKQGLIEFRVNDNADILSKIGVKDFDNEAIFKNFDALAVALAKKKPESIKGKFFLKAFIKTSMGPSIKVDLQ